MNVARGDLSIVGPRLSSPGDFLVNQAKNRIRFDVDPGMLGLWGLKKKTSIDFGTEADSDREYVETLSFSGDLGIVARSLVASVYGNSNAETTSKVRILGIPLHNLAMDEVVDWVSERTPSDEPHQICFVNPHCANVAFKDEDYRSVLQAADLCLVDGIGMRIAGKILKNETRQNVNGTDLFPRLCQRMSESGSRLYLLGAEPGVAEDVANWVKSSYPGVELVGADHGYQEDEGSAISRIRESQADVLLVAMGVPYQDKWISRNLGRLGVGVVMGVGGLFDFYSGKTPRAPDWLREIGLEWVFRLYQEPGRMWRRYLLGNTIFLIRVLRSRIRRSVKRRFRK
jgi:N-acetylglucosaminyldiphosphoundecaprenol N-acetyl-beta-D-mannosaminyltransferase